MKTKLQIIKIGGNIIDNETVLDAFLSDFAKIETPKILIHGGGKLASRMNEKLGIETIMNEGRRITSKENLDVVTMVYAGLINKTITAKLQGYNCNSIGLSGADGNSIYSSKRPEIPVDFGFVGDVEKVNSDFIELLLNNNITPVFCAITHDSKGQLFNTNADTVASEIAIAMSSTYDTELIYCFEKNGVLEDRNDDNSVIKSINLEKYDILKNKEIINEGMLPKMENCFYALNNNVGKVIIGGTNVIQEGNDLFTTLTL